MKIKNKVRNENFPLLIIGIVFLIVGVYFLGDGYSFVKESEKTTAKVISIERERVKKGGLHLEAHYNTYVYCEYNVNGINYKGEFTVLIPLLFEGQNISIYYNKLEASDIKPVGFNSFCIFFPF